MKKTIYLIAFFSLLFSCQKVLEKRPLDAFDENILWNDKNLAQGYIFTTYDSIIGNLYFSKNFDDWTDNTVLNKANDVNAENIDNFTNINDGWDRYGLIRRCNLAIQKLRQSTGILEAEKLQMTGEAKFLRAITYAYLAKLFGGVMIVDSVYDQKTEDFRFSRNSIKETYDFILKDLNEAVEALPATAQTGLATKGAANAFITRVGLMAAAYIPEAKDAYLTQVVKAAKEIINSGVYTLDNDYAGMFNDYDKSLASKEYILGFYKSSTNTIFRNTPMQGICPNHGQEKLNAGFGPAFVESFEGWLDRGASQDLIDSYLVKDTDGNAKKWNQTSYYAAYTSKGGYASDVLYKNRDNRFYASIVYDSTMLFKNFILTRGKGNLNRSSNNTGTGVSFSNYYFKKGLYEKAKLWYEDPTNYAIPVIRLGEVYLNYVEALLLQNNAPEAVVQINKTRVTHGGLNEIAANTPVAELWSIYKDERQVDLLREDDRYWSLLRWGKYENKNSITELSTPVRRIDISADGKTFSFATVTEAGNQNRVFTSRRYLFPVPQGQIQANPNLAPNNEGW